MNIENSLYKMYVDFCQALLWAELVIPKENEDQLGEFLEDKYSISDIDNKETIKDIIKMFCVECEKQNIDIHTINKEMHVGHDLYLTIAGHGAGFWDGDYDYDHGIDTLGNKLTDICEDMVRSLDVCDDGEKVYVSFGMNPKYMETQSND